MALRHLLAGICLLLALFTPGKSNAQQVYPLYPGTIPNSKPNQLAETLDTTGGWLRYGKITQPTIAAYLPQAGKQTGAAVVIFPGGGYWINAYKHEGTEVAEALQQRGIAAFVVKYRIPDSASMHNPVIGPLQDAQQAIRWVRQHATQFGLLANRVGVLGFSAGGHLASTAGTHYHTCHIPNPDSINLRPDFMALIYPVISLAEPFVHTGSANKLLGANAPQSLRAQYSAERNITAHTPPSFLVHTTADNGVSPLHSIYMYQALLQHKVPVEMHIYQNGPHGFGLKLPYPNEHWIDRMYQWMAVNGWLK